ncbi:hypothetical protein [Streptomyces angustmyceticus]|uniref:hypothetical protein n=1 Tax=Streptomyces angustmyceticus TaxID=285578 RepID=UPI0037FF86FD
MRRTPDDQTTYLVDTTVNIGVGAFVAVASLGLVLIYGPAAAPAIVVLTPLAYVANRSYLRRREQRHS